MGDFTENASYFTVAGYDKDAGRYFRFTDFLSIAEAERYAKRLAGIIQPKCSDGDCYDWFEIWDADKNRVAVIGVSR